jgi:hypothetical protein
VIPTEEPFMSRPILLLALLALLLTTAGLRAQEAGDADVRGELRALVTDGGAAEADRRTVADFLDRAAVERAAARGASTWSGCGIIALLVINLVVVA